MTEPHIQRMEEELAQLAERTAKLAAFISKNPIFKQLPSDEKEMMRKQLQHMQGYHDTLETRIYFAERAQ